eukprot:5153427-Pleurochrysis_carterae.AAC.1
MSLVGALLYCFTQTRPDIAHAVVMLCRTMSCPTAQLLSDARRVLMYLYYHRGLGLRYATVDRDEVRGYSNFDWATRRGTRPPETFSFTARQRSPGCQRSSLQSPCRCARPR